MTSNAIVFSERVINALNDLGASERKVIANALTEEFILGQDPARGLSPIEMIIYTMIRNYMVRDMARTVLHPVYDWPS